MVLHRGDSRERLASEGDLMSNAHSADATRANLRTIVAVIEKEMTQLPPAVDGIETMQGLRASWSELVKVLALGPAPETRECPVCHGIGMRAASRCGDCWTALTPLPPLAITEPPPSAS
jgi:hypothetical protein